MALSPAQLAALKADIAADGALSALPNNDDGNFAIAAAYNLPASPAWVVWKTSIPTSECKKAMNWTEYIGRSAGERGAWEMMIGNGTIDPSQVNVRQGIADIFSDVGGVTTRTALTALGKMNATRAQKLFSTGTGSTATPATMAANIDQNYMLGYQEVGTARNLP